MKLKKAKIIIKPLEAVKSEWKKALEGKKRSFQKGNEIVFTGLYTVSRIFSKTRLAILQTIFTKNPKSIYELAKLVKRDFKNVHSDVKFLEEIGMIELQESNNIKNGLMPKAKYSGIELDLAA